MKADHNALDQNSESRLQKIGLPSLYMTHSLIGFRVIVQGARPRGRDKFTAILKNLQESLEVSTQFHRILRRLKLKP